MRFIQTQKDVFGDVDVCVLNLQKTIQNRKSQDHIIKGSGEFND